MGEDNAGVRRSCAVIGLTMLVAGAAHGRQAEAWQIAGDVGRDVLVGAALGLPALSSDWRGEAQAAGSLGAAFLATEALKRAVPERRPDGSDRRGFPSGHSSISFAAAATLQNRRGWQAGVPAHLVAILVGISRTEARKHRWHDVMAGAVIGEMSGLLVTSRRDSTVRLIPWGDMHGGGAAVALAF